MNKVLPFIFLVQLLISCSFTDTTHVDMASDNGCQSGVGDTITPTKPAGFIDSIAMRYDTLLGDCRQLFVVFNAKASSVVSKLQVYELGDGGWVAVDSLACPCNVGRKGIAPYGTKVEGDGKTPTGIFSITHFFSRHPSFASRLEKINVTRNTIWVDDPNDPLYNSYCEQDPAHPKKGERLIRNDAQYDYAMVINYNTKERVPRKGSAIFFHVWTRPGSGTAGCVAVDEANILRLLGWIDADKHPMIIIGSLEDEGIFHIEGTKYQ